ncbi:Hypothetical predicted protein [Cloeon dipterum]|uniref:Uncharacterized protein n=1 Tax=Cloeon dipterum TaxID=197152 RepID=A0A8S1C0S5_9INSE|nr:Hypothetical predicted protein [Cloeon dipterum]
MQFRRCTVGANRKQFCARNPRAFTLHLESCAANERVWYKHELEQCERSNMAAGFIVDSTRFREHSVLRSVLNFRPVFCQSQNERL